MEQLKTLHGSLFDIKCDQFSCDYLNKNNYDDPVYEVLAPAAMDVLPGQLHPLLDTSKELENVSRDRLPKCSSCQVGLLRPGVVWFGEPLDLDMMHDINKWINQEPVDLMLVVGTSAVVYPAASYVERAARAGAKVCTVNIEAENPEYLQKLNPGDFAFAGDAAELLPRLLQPVIGRHVEKGQFEETGGGS